MSGELLTWSRAGLVVCAYLLSAIVLTGCGTGSSADGTIQTSRSITGTVTTVVGKTQTLHVTFIAVGASSLSNLTVSHGLDTLPTGWSGPGTFNCASVATAGDCVLDITFTPTNGGNGTFTLDYSYRAADGTGRTDSVSIDYSASAANTVESNVAPAGRVDAIVGTGTRAVTITFDTNDGTAASSLVVTTDLTSLPAGWSSTAGAFNCDQISTGNGCQLQLSYAPSNVGSGTLVLGYRYDDDGGTARNGSLAIDYGATSHNNLAATVAPSGQINATVGANIQTNITFTTDDGNPVSNVVVNTNLSALPTGWSSAPPSFTCATAGTGNSCQLSLTYAPTATGSGTLTLDYGYNDNAGSPQVGHMTIPYVATANNNVVGSASPSGQIVTAVGASGTVTVTFATDDGNSASSLTVTTDLSSLPGGWSTTSPSFSCSVVGWGNGCQLPLTFAPSSGGSGTLQINFGYINNAGTAKTGSVGVPYVATTPHAYIGQLSGAVGLCSINSNGTLSGCAAGGINGNAIAFSSSHAYIGTYSTSAIYVCDIALDGSLSNCTSTGSNIIYPFVMTVSGNVLYAASGHFQHTILRCSVQTDGSLSNCADTSSLTGVEGLNTANGYLYASQPHSDAVSVCQQAVDGTLSGCATTGSGFSGPEDIAISGSFAFVANTTDGTISTCAINGSNGTLSSCIKSSLAYGPMGIAVHDGRAYVSSRSGNIYVCDINGATGALSNCAISNGGSSLGLSIQIAVR